jgi:Protein of unknown function (DUF1552)
MFITKMSLSRRTFLRGAGVSMALPFLEAMVPAFTATAKTAANPTRRFGAIYIPHGAIMDQWTPATVGGGFEFKPILKALEPFKDRTIIVSNLARPGGESTNTHVATAAGWLSGAIAKPTEGEDLLLGTTADQFVAKQIGQDSPFPSIELAVENFTGYIGACGTNYSCAYANTLAWSSPTTPLPTEINPRVAFERLFGRAGTRERRTARMQEDRRILDAIRQDANELQRGLGARDSARLGDYLDNIREIERRIQRTEEKNRTQVTQLDAPLGTPESYAEHAGLLFDIVAVAYQADLTRVFTLMMGREGSNRTYLDLGIAEGHHQLSHHGGKPEQIAKHARLNAFHLQQFARFIEKLGASPDGDGSVLDHSMICYGSGMSNGNVHSPDPLPMVIMGGVAGKGHRHIQAAPKTTIGNLWVSVAQKFDCELDKVGVSTGRVDL